MSKHKELEKQDAESEAFTARTLIDDTIGRLIFTRDHLWLDAPSDLMNILNDLEKSSEQAANIAIDLKGPPYWVNPESASKCLKAGCSCGMPSYFPYEGDEDA